jgi:hypothetical protein
MHKDVGGFASGGLRISMAVYRIQRGGVSKSIESTVPSYPEVPPGKMSKKSKKSKKSEKSENHCPDKVFDDPPGGGLSEGYPILGGPKS